MNEISQLLCLTNAVYKKKIQITLNTQNSKYHSQKIDEWRITWMMRSTSIIRTDLSELHIVHLNLRWSCDIITLDYEQMPSIILKPGQHWIVHGSSTVLSLKIVEFCFSEIKRMGVIIHINPFHIIDRSELILQSSAHLACTFVLLCRLSHELKEIHYLHGKLKSWFYKVLNSFWLKIRVLFFAKLVL